MTRLMRVGEDGKMTASNIVYRHSIVAEMYIEGKTQSEMAKRLQVTQSTICKDLMKIKEQWKRKYAEDFGVRVSEELARIDRLERAAWEGWERSCQDAETKVQRKEMAIPKVKDDDKKKKPSGKQELIPVKVLREKTSRGQSGDPRFLAQVQACIDMRLRIIGAYKVDGINGKADKTGHIVMNWDEFYEKMEIRDPVDAEIQALPAATTPSKGETS